ncbi:MAG: arylsulfotransferase family protein [Actinomycetota bacterium]|nr:arylsulfotransferase family protein [Actinomycetota bacterium]
MSSSARRPVGFIALLVSGLIMAVVLLELTGMGEGSAGAAVTVIPGPTAKNASVWSGVSFRGVRAGKAGPISIRGSRSGRHSATRKRHGDNRGFSLVLKRSFRTSEYVTVKTRLRVNGASGGTWRFRTENLGGPRSKRVAPRERKSTGFPGYRTRPNLAPPRMEISTRTDAASKKPLFIGAKDAGTTIYDADGEPVWIRPGRTMDFRTQKWRGRPVLTWFEAPTKGSGLKRNMYMIADRSYRIIRRVTPGNGYSADSHEFRMTSRGTAFITSYRTHIRDLRSVGQAKNGRVSDSIAQEIDLKTGRVIWEWHSLDHVPVRHTYAETPRRPGTPFDYFHINTIADTPDGNVLITGRSTNAVYKVSRKTGRILWTLGGRASDFRMGKGAAFSWQHDSQLLPGGRISIYDNGHAPVIAKPWRNQSRGVILKLDQRRKRATVVNRFFHPARPLASTQGNLQNLGGGRYLVGWGGVPLVSEHDSTGKLLFDARLTGVGSFYRAYRANWQGRPKSKVAVVAQRTSNPGQTRLWISRNGDTATRRWQILAGPSANSLSVVATRARDGFETVTAAPTSARFIKVRGLDSKGKVTGNSAAVRSAD